MLKRFALKKFIIVSLSFLVLLIIYLFPEKDEYEIKTTLTYTNPSTMPIYIVDKNDLIARFEVLKKSTEPMETVEEVISSLTIDSPKSIPPSFKKIIPKGTKIINTSLKDGLLKINFSKELLDIPLEDEEKLLESIIYSLTEINGVEKIMIFVEGESFLHLPKSKKNIPAILDRNYGINKMYDLNSLKEVNKVTAYYVSKDNNYSYYVPITMITNNPKEKIEIIIEKLKTSPSYQTNLVSFLTNKVELQNYEILEKSVNLSFNNEVLSLENNKIIEEVKYSIALSVKDTYNISETIFYVDNILMDVFFE